MSTATKIARSFGLPESTANRTVDRLARVAVSVRSVNPAGAAAIFAVAYIAGAAGSLAVLLIAAALFVGLYAARVASPSSTIEPYDWSKIESQSLGMPDDVASCFGLPIAEVKFKTAPKRPAKPKQAAPV